MGKVKIELNEWSRWYLVPEKDKKKNPLLKIKRYRTITENGVKKTKWERCKEDYDPKASRQDLERLIRQLNLRHGSELKRAKEAYEWRHAFITDKIMEDYKTFLKANVDSKTFRDTLYFYARKNLNWFIEKCREPDPLEWKGLQTRWSLALFCDLEGLDADKYRMWDEPVAPDTISKQMQGTNRLLEWLHDENPKVFPSVRLKAYSKSKMRAYRMRWKTKGVGKYIPDHHMQIILENIDPKIRPYVWRQNTFGLRLQEAMACQPADIKNDFLRVHQQLVSVTDGKPQYDILKDREERKVPHWFANKKETYQNFTQVNWLMHPDTYSHKFSEEMARISEEKSKVLKGEKLDYATHDLRRTFITNSFREGKVPDEIRLAAGHSDIRTTMKYARDHRELSGDATYVPEKDNAA
jgi:hypothetical protein